MMILFIPFFVLSEHCIQNGQKFAHKGNHIHFFGFSCHNPSHVKCFYHWIEEGCNECKHIQRGSNPVLPAKNSSPPSNRVRVSIYLRNPHKYADFRSKEVAKFTDFHQQSLSSNGTYVFNAAQLISKLFKVVSDVVAHILIDSPKFNLQRFDDDINVFFLWDEQSATDYLQPPTS